MNTKPEILAPAGGPESINAAVRCGADAVYVGGSCFSARAGAVNFTDEQLKEAVSYCHLHGVKVYRAMNTVIFDSECEEFIKQVKFSAEIGIDGLIVQDLGALELIKNSVADMPVHASTQLTAATPMSVIAAKKAGFCRVVPARELSLEQIEKICKTGVETEVFVHGAQCMCLSGQCYMSALIGSRSANRGQCAQACRLPFSAKGLPDENSCALSLKDMSLVSHIEELTAAGAASFKIEGRMKRPEYTAAAVTALYNAVNGTVSDEDISRLEAVFSRSGFTDGYLTGRPGADMFGSRRKEDVVKASGVLDELAALYKDETKTGGICFDFTAKACMPCKLIFSCKDISGEIYGMIPEAARNRSITSDDVIKQLSKLGSTVYQLENITCDIDDGLMLPASELNRLRREACAMADKLITEKNTPVYNISENKPALSAKTVRFGEPEFRLKADKAEKIIPYADMAELLILPVSECAKLSDDNIIAKTAVCLPSMIHDEERVYTQAEELIKKGFIHFYCGNFTHIGILSQLRKKYTIKIHGGSGMNITNSYAADKAYSLGLCDMVLSFELKAGQICALRSPVPTGITAYGRLPVMTVRNCPVKAQVGCKKCTGSITDRTGRSFPVKCSDGYAVIYNCDILEISDRLDSFKGIAFAVLDLSGNDSCDCRDIINRYINKHKPTGKFTRGLYSRGVI